MRSANHVRHLAENTSHSSCSECRADTERRFARNVPFKYAHVHEYLSYVRPRVEAIRQGEDSGNARVWMRDFLKAMHRRISTHATGTGRKWSDSYLDRMRQFRADTDSTYLRQFASRGASCLDY